MIKLDANFYTIFTIKYLGRQEILRLIIQNLGFKFTLSDCPINIDATVSLLALSSVPKENFFQASSSRCALMLYGSKSKRSDRRNTWAACSNCFP